MIAERSVMTVIAPSHSRCSTCFRRLLQQSACEKIIDWSRVQSCGEYKQLEQEGTAEMAEFSAGLQTRQEERYVFWLLLGGDLT